jgi:hypothetical protein
MADSQYLNKEILLNNIPNIHVTKDDLGSTDTYHEDKILKKYLSLSKDGQELVYKAAIQMSVIGFGNKNYGFIRLNEKDIITLIDLFKKYNIKYNEKLNSKYTDDELSARRLIRLFRYQIQKFIIENKKPSFLWNKYANKTNQEYISICFPGGEHVLETIDQAEFLLNTYGALDQQMNTKFRERLKRVFIARKILSPEYFLNKTY